MTKLKFMLILFLIPIFAFTMHKYYISFTNIEYKKENNSLQITIKLFIDDLQETINNTYNTNHELTLQNERSVVDSLIVKYSTDHFKIELNENATNYLYLGKEYDSDVVYLYFEIENIQNLYSIGIQNNMLIEFFPEQKNIVKLNINKRKKSFILTSDNDKEMFDLKIRSINN